MTKAAPSPTRTRVVSLDPSSLTLSWLLDEMVKGELITATAARQLVDPPRRKDGTTHHPLVIAAAQDWPDRRNDGRKLSLEVLTQRLPPPAPPPYARIHPPH